MSERRNGGRGTPRDSEGSWRARGRGRGRGAAPISSLGHGTTSSSPIVSNQRDNRTEPKTLVSDPVLARRRMNLMASVSRSSGLEKDGDDLKNYKIQEEYRIFIQEKVDEIFKDRPRSASDSENERKKRIDSQENTLILFRKLREGVSSSNRNDAFALETYETSLYLSALFDSPKQTISIIPHLLPVRHEEQSKFLSDGPSVYTVVISLLHHLVAQYPSQGTYFQQLDSIPNTLLNADLEVKKWMTSLTRCLRARNYAEFSKLSQRSHIMPILQPSLASDKDSNRQPVGPKSDSDFGLKAILTLLEALRKKASEATWTIIRAAYRELSCDSTPSETQAWLSRSLSLDSLLDRNLSINAEKWLIDKIPAGHVRRKDGAGGKWIVCKVR